MSSAIRSAIQTPQYLILHDAEISAFNLSGIVADISDIPDLIHDGSGAVFRDIGKTVFWTSDGTTIGTGTVPVPCD